VQNNNCRINCRLTMNGQTLTAAEWSRIVGISAKRIRWRVLRGWSDVKALTTPVRKLCRQT
jgi:hypothetical protein